MLTTTTREGLSLIFVSLTVCIGLKSEKVQFREASLFTSKAKNQSCLWSAKKLFYFSKKTCTHSRAHNINCTIFSSFLAHCVAVVVTERAVLLIVFLLFFSDWILS